MMNTTLPCVVPGARSEDLAMTFLLWSVGIMAGIMAQDGPYNLHASPPDIVGVVWSESLVCMLDIDALDICLYQKQKMCDFSLATFCDLYCVRSHHLPGQ
jgi:hypothetical protein